VPHPTLELARTLRLGQIHKKEIYPDAEFRNRTGVPDGSKLPETSQHCAD
jgi:hypothetical protein